MDNRWGLLYAAWGDVLCSLSVLRDSGIRRAFYFGKHQGMRDFILSQDFIDDVLMRNYVMCGMRDNIYYGLWHNLHIYNEKQDVSIDKIVEVSEVDISPSEIVNSVVDYKAVVHPVYQLRHLSLPVEMMGWAEQEVLRRRNYVLLCPYSYNSSSNEEHWPHWESYVDWLLASYPRTLFIYCGVDIRPKRWSGYRNFVNFFRHTPTAAHMYALALRADKVITTANGLLHWMNAMERPVLVMSTRACSEPSYFFSRILDERHVRLLPHGVSLDEACEATRLYLGMSSGESFSSAENLRSLHSSDMRFLFCKSPFMSEMDIVQEASYDGREHDVYRQMFSVLGGSLSLFELGPSSGQVFLSLLASGANLTRAGWCVEGGMYFNASDRLRRNISHYLSYYLGRDCVPIVSCDRYVDCASVMSGFDAVWVGGALDYASRLEDLRRAFASSASLIFCPGCLASDVVFAAARQVSQEFDVRMHVVDSATGLVVWDRTSERVYLKRLLSAGMCRVLD